MLFRDIFEGKLYKFFMMIGGRMGFWWLFMEFDEFEGDFKGIFMFMLRF